MFYSHEVLTSRKYGVATVWLVATLGSKSSLKRINRKQILDVDVPKACQTIVDPVAPLALRLQGNLLYGLSHVYLQQCGYILSDAQNAQLALMAALRTAKDTALDSAAGKTRPEQLVLQDDPSFLPEFAHPPPELLVDLDPNFNLGATHSGDSQNLSPFGSQQSASTSHTGSVGGLVLPTSSPTIQGGFGLEGGHATGSVSMLGSSDMIEIGDPDFMFGEDGEIIPLSSGTVSLGNARATTPCDGNRKTRLKRQVQEEQDACDQDDNMTRALPNEEDGLPESHSFSSTGRPHSDQHSEVVESSESFTASMRRRRVPRIIRADAVTELRNKDLADWNANYLNNMKVAARQKVHNRALTQAKKNAEHYVWGSGLGNIGKYMINSQGYNPFNMFIGDELFEAITGISRKVTELKHGRDSGIDDATQEQARRVRQRTGEPEAARGADHEGFFMPLGDDDDDDTVELPREVASALDDQQVLSSLPWNMSASIRGSSVIPHSGRIGLISSADRRWHSSRQISTSPLRGRGQPLPFELKHLTSDASYAGDDFGLLGLSSESPEPAALPDTSSRLRNALSAEGENFITYMTEKMSEKRDQAQNDTGAVTSADTITFEELLPPAENTKTIACHGFIMVLTLGTKDMLNIQQAQHFGDIHLGLSEKARALWTIDTGNGRDSSDDSDSDDNEEFAVGPVLPIDIYHTVGEPEERNEEEDPADMEEGHFQEQFAAGHGAQQEDDIDSLYAD